jgi:hypothetical protein
MTWPVARIVDILNLDAGEDALRYYKVVANDYVLKDEGP